MINENKGLKHIRMLAYGVQIVLTAWPIHLRSVVEV